MKPVKNKMCSRSGAVLLIVLFIVMVATILGLGFITRSNIDLACGRNMALKVQMDLLAESGLVHARGLILNPQDVDTQTYGCWAGVDGQQLVAGSSDYYDIGTNIDISDHCNYIIDCNAYRLKDGQELGRSSLRAELRLDPCIAFWAGTNTTLADSLRIDGDVYCNGNLTNNAILNGDVFTDGAIIGSEPVGQQYTAAEAEVSWPGDVISSSDLSSNYYIESNTYAVTPVDSNYYSGSWPSAGGSNPKKVYYCDHQLELGGNVIISGTLVVDANLVITGAGNSITAEKNFPALLVNGELIIQGGLEINGLAIVTQQVVVDPNATNFTVNGGLFIRDGGISISSPSPIIIKASPQKAAIRKWPGSGGDPMDWSQASDAFFKSISKS